MVMNSKLVRNILIVVVVIILCIPIISDMISNSTIKTIEYADFDTTVQNTSSYNFALVYVAPSSDENTKTIKGDIREYIDEFANSDSSTGRSLEAYYIDYDELSSDEVIELFNGVDSDTAYYFISNGSVVKTITDELKSSTIKDYISEYSANGIAEDLVYYKVAEDAKTYEKLVDSKKIVTMAVFGRSNCFYCNQYQPVYNTVAEEENIDIYYFDSTTYDSEEYDKIMDLDLKIPASCTGTDEDANLADGFDTPLTLFTKNGKVIDCISGYVNKDTLLTKLETVGMIEFED